MWYIFLEASKNDREADEEYSWSDFPVPLSHSVNASPMTPRAVRNVQSTSALADDASSSPRTPPPDALLLHQASPMCSPSLNEARRQRQTPPPTPPLVKMQLQQGASNMQILLQWSILFLYVAGKYPTTPPPKKRNTLHPHPEAFASGPLTKSKSHESQLPNRVNSVDLDMSRYSPTHAFTATHLPIILNYVSSQALFFSSWLFHNFIKPL